MRVGSSLLSLALALMLCQSLHAQKQDDLSRVALGMSFPWEGQETGGVFLNLSPAKDVKIARLEFTVQFPNKFLTFEKVQVGPKFEGDGIELTVRDQRTADGVTTVKFAISSGTSAKSWLPAGDIASLSFKIMPGQTIGQSGFGPAVKLNLSIDTIQSPDGAPVPSNQLKVTNGFIQLVKDGYMVDVSCFFFTH